MIVPFDLTRTDIESATMDGGGGRGSIAARGAMRKSLAEWANFISQCLKKRLDFNLFGEYVKELYAQHPLPPSVIATFLFSPRPNSHYTLDMRIPPYAQTLLQLGCLDAPSVLQALYNYSSSHAQSQAPPDSADGQANGETGKEKTEPRRWQNSYWAEEVIFYNLTKAVVMGSAIPNAKVALEVARVTAKWVALFTAASTAFAADMLGNLQTSRAREEMETARAGFVALLLRLGENDVLVNTMGKPFAKGTVVLPLAHLRLLHY